MKSYIATALLGATLITAACERTPVQPLEEQSGSLASAAQALENTPEMQRQLAALRRATARFQNVEAARAAGYVPISPCVAHPLLGGMGYHFGRPDIMNDAEISAEAPEILLYAPHPNGSLKLVGIEFWIVEAAWQAAGKSGVPTFAGKPLDFDLANDHGLPNRYTLHVWNWLPNPSGMFAPFNPRFSCPPEEHAGRGAHASH